MKKYCSSCRETKGRAAFNKDARTIDGYATRCRECMNKYHELFRHSYKEQHPQAFRARATINNHRIKGIDIKVSREELEKLFETTHCPICGCEFDKTRTISNGNSPSLDRLNNENELRIDNVWVICKKCNITKSNRTMKEFYDYCKTVVIKFEESLN